MLASYYEMCNIDLNTLTDWKHFANKWFLIIPHADIKENEKIKLFFFTKNKDKNYLYVNNPTATEVINEWHYFYLYIILHYFNTKIRFKRNVSIVHASVQKIDS